MVVKIRSSGKFIGIDSHVASEVEKFDIGFVVGQQVQVVPSLEEVVLVLVGSLVSLDLAEVVGVLLAPDGQVVVLHEFSLGVKVHEKFSQGSGFDFPHFGGLLHSELLTVFVAGEHCEEGGCAEVPC